MGEENGDNGDNGKKGAGGQSGKPKDFWDKAEIVAKLAIPVVLGLLGIYGNHYLNKRQEAENNLMLYSQLLSAKETSENVLRKDMFSQILQSFIGGHSTNESGLDRIKEMRLSLELLSRNFHESLDMKPLFRHLLMRIVAESHDLRHAKKTLDELLAPTAKEDDAKLKEAVKQAEDALKNLPVVQQTRGMTRAKGGAIVRDAQEGKAKSAKMVVRTSSTRKHAERVKEKVDESVARYESEMRELTEIAKRVARKQSEVLQDVAGTVKLTFSKREQCLMLVRSLKPTEKVPACDEEFIDRGCVLKEERLVFKDAAGKTITGSARHFKLRVRYAYPQWRRVLVEVESWPCLQNETIRNCDKCSTQPKERKAFWLDHFDFPLVDSSYIDRDHRYSVVLENLDVEQGQGQEIENATITLLYYPASYAGLKEKSFYDNQLFNNLVKWNMFRKE